MRATMSLLLAVGAAAQAAKVSVSFYGEAL